MSDIIYYVYCFTENKGLIPSTKKEFSIEINPSFVRKYLAQKSIISHFFIYSFSFKIYPFFDTINTC